AAFTITAFHNDIGITEVFGRFYQQVVGGEKPRVTLIEISYSIGLAVGITVFYNHFGTKKITHDPTPIQVEMRKYEQDLDTAIIENSARRGENLDVS
ncbi:MAG: stage V sporulation protein AA, partial [Pararoseburia sp.]|nr:stage V sporulation protein AA [Pararoseburia sp.]